MAFHREHVLEGDGHAEEWLLGVGDARGDGLVRGIGLCEGIVVVVAEEGLDSAVHPPDLVEAGLHGLAGGHVAIRELCGEFAKGELGWPGHSTIFGTMNRPLARAGALRSASSVGREGRTSSGRVTLTIGTAWAVGSTWLTSTSLSFSM